MSVEQKTKPVTEWTDQEIGEWLAVNVMGWRSFSVGWLDSDEVAIGHGDWDPAANIAQAFECQKRVKPEFRLRITQRLATAFYQTRQDTLCFEWFVLTVSARLRAEAIVQAMIGETK